MANIPRPLQVYEESRILDLILPTVRLGRCACPIGIKLDKGGRLAVKF